MQVLDTSGVGSLKAAELLETRSHTLLGKLRFVSVVTEFGFDAEGYIGAAYRRKIRGFSKEVSEEMAWGDSPPGEGDPRRCHGEDGEDERAGSGELWRDKGPKGEDISKPRRWWSW